MEQIHNIIEIKNLSKSFGDIKAVQNLSFHIKKGEFFAFLGVNGAGKSTTISMICGQLKKDSGTLLIGGENTDTAMDKIAGKLGVVFQNSVLDQSLSVEDNLKSRAALYGITGETYKKRLKEVSRLLEFENLLDRTVAKLSGGQRRRIDIARAIFHRPEVLILDEPTTGLDPQTRKLLWNVISKLQKEENMTVLLTTHYMEETADADYVLIIDSGKIAAEGTPLQLKNKYAQDYITLYGADEEKVKSLSLPYVRVRDGYRVTVSDTGEATKIILKHPELFTDYEIIKGNMDDVFLEVTGKTLENSSSSETA